MPIILNLVNLDEMYANARTPPLIINDLASRSEGDREYFNSLIRETYTTDMVSVLPQCHCGELKGEHLIGTVCDKCNMPVRQSIEDDITPNLWFRKPIGIVKLINPMVFTMLSKRFSPAKFKIMNWLTDRNYTHPGRTPDVVKRMAADGIQRGYNNFVLHFDEIMQYLFNCSEFKANPKKGILGYIVDMLDLTHPSKDPLQQLLHDRRDAIFCDYLPIPNRALLILEKTALGHFVDGTTAAIQNTLNTMLSIDKDFYDRSEAAIENRTGKITAMLSSYYATVFYKNMSPKPGLLRKHWYGSRINMAFRAVITSHEEIEDHDVIHIPWGVGLTVWRLHILNILMSAKCRFGPMMQSEATDFIMRHIYKYHPYLDEILQGMCHSKKYKGCPLLLQRNPTLTQGSAQLVYATRVKTDPFDCTVSMSDLIAM